MAEDDSFIGLIAYLKPHYVIPSRRFFTENVLPDLYEELRKNIAAKVAKVDHVSFTSDIWTCPSSHETFLSLSAHWITVEYVRKNAVFHASHFSKSHTGVNIADKLMNMWEAWNLDAQRRRVLVRDGATNMLLGSNLSEIESIHCSIHIIQFIINDAILSHKKDVLVKSRRLATHFNHSAKACSEFKAIQSQTESEMGKAPLILLQDVPTRWNSAYLMLRRMEELKRPLQLYLSDHDELPNFSSSEWQIIEQVVTNLQPFSQLTIEMSAESCPLSTVIPSVSTLARFFEKTADKEGIKITKQRLLSALRTRLFCASRLEVLLLIS
ncbi:zinc finger BED domain-containing protein 4-like [Scylla paramamosain]|uniref:zinc finger BED domain-containing protein 4-like n=1 Tax=Scylla paramamosain TaxID=85552 RepID=UPI003082AFED